MMLRVDKSRCARFGLGNALRVAIEGENFACSLDRLGSASTIATVIETIDHGLNISQAGVPVSAAARPPSQNQPGG